MALQDRIRNLRQQKRAGTLDEAGMGRLQSLRARKKSQNGGGMHAGGGKAGGGKAFGDKRPMGQMKELLGGFYGNIHDQMGQIGDSMKAIDFGALPDAPGSQDLAGERSRIEGDLYSKYTDGFDDQKAKDMQGMEQRLAERGIMPGSGEAYENEQNRFNDTWDGRYADAKSASVEAGGQEFERSFGIGRLGRDDALGEQLLARQMPMQQLQGLMGLSSGLQDSLQNNKFFNKNQKFQKWATEYGGDLQKQMQQMQQAGNMQMAQFGVNNRPGPAAPNLAPPPLPPQL